MLGSMGNLSSCGNTSCNGLHYTTLPRLRHRLTLSMDPRIFAGAPSGLKNSFGLNVLSNIPVYQYFSVKNVRFGLLWVRARPANRFSIAVAL